MANVLGTLASSLILQRALELVFTERPVLNAITLDLAPDAVKFNQTVITRTKSVAAVNNFGTGASDRADTDVPVTINQFKEIHHAFTIQELSSTDRNLVEESARPIAVGLANHMVDALAANWIAANFTNSTTVAAAWDYENTLIAIRKALAGRGVPAPWFFVANSDVYNSLLTDTTVISALNNPSNGDAIRTGRLPMVSGMQIMEYPGLATTGNMVGFAAHMDSTVMASRPPADPRDVLPSAAVQGNIGYITEPRTGLTVMVNEWVDMTTLTANVRMVWMYGTAKGNGNNGQILKTA